MTEQSNKRSSINAQPRAKEDASAAHEAKPAQTLPESRAAPQKTGRSKRKRKLLAGGLGVVVLAVLLVFGIPLVEEMLNTVSTDDSYVNGHVTFVAPRVEGQVSRVLVDDNNRVRKGDLLVELDKEPYRVAVSEKKGSGRHCEGRPPSGHRFGARDRSAGKEPTLEPATRRAGCRQPGRSPARAGRRCGQEQGRIGTGAG